MGNELPDSPVSDQFPSADRISGKRRIFIRRDFPAIYIAHKCNIAKVARALGLRPIVLLELLEDDVELAKIKMNIDLEMDGDVLEVAYEKALEGNISMVKEWLRIRGSGEGKPWLQKGEFTHKHEGFSAPLPSDTAPRSVLHLVEGGQDEEQEDDDGAGSGVSGVAGASGAEDQGTDGS